jgi:O-acetyl-ADP-ribose deacetylase (regulator of RNase III)
MALRVLNVFKSSTVRLRLLKGNIAAWQGDCLVNAANMQLVPSNLPDYWRHIGRKDVNTAVHEAAGPGLAEECALLPESKMESRVKADRVASAPASGAKIRCPRGEARLTFAHNLNAQHVIHAVGPDYDTSVRCAGGGQAMATAHEEAKLLLDLTYSSIFRLANDVKAESIGCPALSCGVMGFGGFDSVSDAAQVSIAACLNYVESVQKVDFVLWEDTTIEAWTNAARDNPDLADCHREP